VPALLRDLAARFALVAVVSGRPPTFLAEVLGEPTGVELVGLYGLARALGGTEEAARWAAVIDEVVAEATAAAPDGVYVEPKGLTTTLHWRHAPDAQPWVQAFARREAAERGLALHPGRMELELRPPIAVDKGTVVHALAAEHDGRLRAAAAFGDDMGDLPAFAAVGELSDLSGAPLTVVRVAAVDDESPREVAAQADLTVPGAAGAVAVLRALADAAR
jgi:trehalose 6-phosphate phosphatase